MSTRPHAHPVSSAEVPHGPGYVALEIPTGILARQLLPAEARELAEELLDASTTLDPCQFGITVDGSRGRGWCNAHQRHCRFEELFRIGAAGGPWANPER